MHGYCERGDEESGWVRIGEFWNFGVPRKISDAGTRYYEASNVH